MWTSSSWPAGDEDLTAGTTVAARLIEICGQVAWPVDAALRPEGSRGPLVRTLASHQAYYRRWARTWEFQALLKARPGGRRPGAGAGVDRRPGAAGLARRRAARGGRRRPRHAPQDHRQRAGRTRWTGRSSAARAACGTSSSRCSCCSSCTAAIDETLREPGTLPALRALVAGGYVGREDGETLLRGYRFLRSVEHRLQLQNLRRTHTVPDDPHGAALAGRRARLHRAARARRRRGVPVGLGRARRAGPPPAREAALPAAAGGGRPGARRGAADDARSRPAGGWRSSASPTRPARCATCRR